VDDNLLFSLPLYQGWVLGATPLEVLLVCSLALGFAVRSWIHRPAAFTMLTWCVLLFLILIMAAYLRGSSHRALTELRLILPFFLSFAAAIHLGSSTLRLRWLRRAILMGALAGSARAFILWIQGLGFHYETYLRVSVDTGDFLFLSFTLVWILGSAILSGKRWHLFFLPPIVFGLIFSFARGAWVVSAVSVLAATILTLIRIEHRRFLWVIPLISLVVGALVLITGSSGQIETRAASILDWSHHNPNVYRLIETRNALNTIGRHPGWGGGLGAHYRDTLALRSSLHQPLTTLVHDNFLWLALKGGWLLSGTFVTLMGMGVFRSAKLFYRARNAEARIWYLASASLLCGYFVYSFAGALLQHVRDNVLLGLVLGLAVLDLGSIKSTTADHTQ